MPPDIITDPGFIREFATLVNDVKHMSGKLDAFINSLEKRVSELEQLRWKMAGAAAVLGAGSAAAVKLLMG